MKTNAIVALLLLSASPALAADPPPSVSEAQPPPKRDRGEFMIAVKAGGLFPQAFSNLGPSYLVDLELGYALPILKHRLAITIEGAYTAPEANGSQLDTRLDAAGGPYTWHLQQREVMLGLTFIYRHPLGRGGRFIPYAGVGPRLFLLESEVSGKAGTSPISTSSETSTKAGVGIPLGFGVTLGPGHLFLEAAVLIGNIDHLTTGNVTVGVSSISVVLGYRFML